MGIWRVYYRGVMSVTLNPYLFFVGTCRPAMEFYQSVFGGGLEIHPYSEMMGADAPNANNVMHANLTGGLVSFMASDGDRTEPYGTSCISLALGGSDEGVLTDVFNKLGEGGKVDQPLSDAPWGGKFGMLTDKFGIDWMFNIEA